MVAADVKNDLSVVAGNTGNEPPAINTAHPKCSEPSAE
ncbi:MAG: hypothetical protein JST50_07745 [Bacteroidetes bacterium]|nr:hypothetical protein [Bacteroidota bacterium]